jgi:beta-glucosidase
MRCWHPVTHFSLWSCHSGASETVRFHLTTRDLASFDEQTSSWIAEAGVYQVNVGASSLKTPQTASFKMKKDVSAGTVSRALAPEGEIKRIQPKK